MDSGFVPTAIVRMGKLDTKGGGVPPEQHREIANLFGDVLERMYKFCRFSFFFPPLALFLFLCCLLFCVRVIFLCIFLCSVGLLCSALSVMCASDCTDKLTLLLISF